MIAALVLAVQTVAVAQPGVWGIGCTDEDIRVIADAAEDVLHGGDGWVRGEVERRAEASNGRCAGLALLQTAMRGWAAARSLAPIGGGDHGHLQSVRRTLTALDPLATGPLALDAEYADVAVRAALAAAQDERSELELLLAHARDLTERLAARGRLAAWPRPFNLLAGELWLEVDRYEEARAAFARAVRDGPSPLALSGLGRALARLDRQAEACQAFRAVRGATNQLAKELPGLLAGCP